LIQSSIALAMGSGQWAIENGADINQILYQSVFPTILITAASKYEPDTVQYLLEMAADPLE
ncbi:hypothetical protein, partial [Serratia marcescens]|uniref:hypothetical protein n=1 Tax=Serratia marcescens TaxID=615 RepID=UPI0013DB9D05